MNKKIKIILVGASGLILIIFSLITSLPDGKLLLVFCDVGQGDATYIRTPGGADILVDGGPDSKVLDCLSKHMPFWDRDLELVLLTHPQADHLSGLLGVLQRYKVESFGIGVEGNDSQGYKGLIDLLKKNNVKIFNPFLGQKIAFEDGVSFDVVWPDSDWVASQVGEAPLRQGFAGQGAVLGVSTKTDLNIFSTVLLLRYKDFDALLTGDADSTIQAEILKDNNLGQADVLKVPHHGSKTALLDNFLNTIKPKMAVISVGKNSYGHPNAELIERLKVIGASIKRTDEGEVEIVSNGDK